jgi:NtrC-family two-component system sensor histidine kinase KinB
MSPEKRSAIFRSLTGLTVLAYTAVTWPHLTGWGLIDWLLFGSVALLLALVQNLGVSTGLGPVTFSPIISLMAYMAFGRETGWLAMIAGLVLGGAWQVGTSLTASRRTASWWEITSGGMWPIGQNGLSLLAADWAYHSLDGSLPLAEITSYQALLPIVVAPVVFLIAYDLLIAFDLLLQDAGRLRLLVVHRWVLLAVQLLPMALAPFSALALSRLGIFSFFLSEIILLAIVIVINRLTITQDALQQQVKQLSSISSMNRSLRTSLEMDALLETVYLQVANLLSVKNLHIVLIKEVGERTESVLRYAVEGGRRAQHTAPFHPDDLASWVIKERVPLLASPIQETAQRLGLRHTPRGRAWMGAPLMASNRTLGCMYTWLDKDERPDQTFGESDLDMFTTVAIQAAIAVQNALLYEQAQKHASQLARLNQISTMMNASLNPERVLELIAASATEVAGCDKAAIYLLEPDSEDPSLLLAHAQGFSREHIVRSKDIAIPMGKDERELVIGQGKVIAIPNIHQKDAGTPAATRVLAERERFAAYAYLPLTAQKSPIGMLAVYYDQAQQFTEGELELLETFANQAALAVVNARIYQRVDIQLARRVEQAMRMTDINHRLSSTLDLQTIFDLIIDTAMEATKADAGVLVLSGDAEFGMEDTIGNPHMVAWRGFDPASSMRAPHHVAEELANSQVLQSGETVLASVDDPVSPGPRSQLGVPIMLSGRVIGAIALESALLNAFADDDVSFVGQLAIQAAVAIRNAQLYRRSQIVRDRLHAILDSSSDGLLMIDEKSRIVMTNTRMGDFWDFARQDFSPRSPDQLVADPLTALGEGLGYREGELSTLLGRSIRNPNANPRTDLYVTRPGVGQRQRFVERTVTPVRDDQGNFIGLLLLFRDVTEQKELEEARESLTSMIVHDLRSPLQAVMGGMRVISDRVEQKDPVVEQATEVSGRAVKKLLNLVNNLLDLSRLESGEIMVDKNVTNVCALLEDAAQELMPLAREMDAIIRVECPEDLPDGEIDRDMIERVVLNLLDNALKYAPPGSVVTVNTRKTHEQDPRGGNMIRVAVIDSGPGIPDDFKDRIFDRFTQIPGQKGRRRSAGLGLAFCRIAVEAHGGQIWVEENPEGGSVFAFTLPPWDAKPPPAEGTPSPQKEKQTPARLDSDTPSAGSG